MISAKRTKGKEREGKIERAYRFDFPREGRHDFRGGTKTSDSGQARCDLRRSRVEITKKIAQGAKRRRGARNARNVNRHRHQCCRREGSTPSTQGGDRSACTLFFSPLPPRTARGPRGSGESETDGWRCTTRVLVDTTGGLCRRRTREFLAGCSETHVSRPYGVFHRRGLLPVTVPSCRLREVSGTRIAGARGARPRGRSPGRCVALQRRSSQQKRKAVVRAWVGGCLATANTHAHRISPCALRVRVVAIELIPIACPPTWGRLARSDPVSIVAARARCIPRVEGKKKKNEICRPSVWSI